MSVQQSFLREVLLFESVDLQSVPASEDIFFKTGALVSLFGSKFEALNKVYSPFQPKRLSCLSFWPEIRVSLTLHLCRNSFLEELLYVRMAILFERSAAF